MVEVLKGMTGWTTKVYPAEDDDHNPTWPDWMSKEKLAQERAGYESIGRVSGYFREYLCKIISSEDKPFKEEMMKYYDGEITMRDDEHYLIINMQNGITYNPPMMLPVNVFMGIDPASSTGENANYTGIVVCAVTKTMDRYIHIANRYRMHPMPLADKIIELYQQNLPTRSRIESSGYQDMLRQYIRSKIVIPGFEIKEKPRQKKLGEGSRIESLQPMFAQGKIFFKTGLEDITSEFLMYPKSKYDDLMDALWYAAKNNFAPFHDMPVVRQKLPESTRYFIGLNDEFEVSELEIQRRIGADEAHDYDDIR